MATFLQIQKRANDLTPQKIKNDLFKFIRTLEPYLAELNKNQIHNNSSDVNGNPIGYYSKATEIITTENLLLGRGGVIKKEGTPFDLTDTGDFLKGLFAKADKDSVFFDTTDPKKTEVVNNLLSKDIFGLTDSELEKVIEDKMTPFIHTYLRKELL